MAFIAIMFDFRYLLLVIPLVLTLGVSGICNVQFVVAGLITEVFVTYMHGGFAASFSSQSVQICI